jgi:ribosomal-protein-alanine N-acetyltransferase
MSRATGRHDQSGWRLSAMTPHDLPEIVAIERASFPNPWSGALFLQELRLPFSRTTVVRDGGPETPVIGYVCRWFVADEMHILNVAVDPAHRRRGIGEMLLRETLREARALRSEAVTLEVRRGNLAARRLYETLHFEEVGVRRNYYGSGEDALIMRLTLTHD